jgi:cell division protein FtsB
MKVIKRKKSKNSILLKTAVFSFAVYIIFALVDQQIQITQKRQELATVNQKIATQQIKNEDIKHALNNGVNENKDYIERVARENLNLAKPGERVFVNVAGN